MRGSTAHPETIVLNTNDVLRGKIPDVELRPNDILYVSARPWKFADELLDVAISAFVQAATTTYTGANVPNVIRHPILPRRGSVILDTDDGMKAPHQKFCHPERSRRIFRRRRPRDGKSSAELLATLGCRRRKILRLRPQDDRAFDAGIHSIIGMRGRFLLPRRAFFALSAAGRRHRLDADPRPGMVAVQPGHPGVAAPSSMQPSPVPPPRLDPARPAAGRFDPRAARSSTPVNTFRKLHTDSAIDRAWLTPPNDPYRVGPGDQLEVELMEFSEVHETCMVLPDGTVFFHILDGMKVSGMTLEDIKAAMETALANDYKNPHVSIILRAATNRKVWVLGRCKRPGVFTLANPTTVLEGIARAGGFAVENAGGDTEEVVDLPHAFMVRDGRFMPIDFVKLIREGDMSQNIYLQNNDSIFLPSAAGARAYVMGAVREPRVVDFRDQLTLSAAIANVGGLAPNAYPQHVVIIRDSLTNPRAAIVNFSEIVHGKASDVLLEPKDIVWVPNSPFTRLDQYFHLIVNSFVRTVAANEGIRAGAPGKEAAGVNIGINVQ